MRRIFLGLLAASILCALAWSFRIPAKTIESRPAASLAKAVPTYSWKAGEKVPWEVYEKMNAADRLASGARAEGKPMWEVDCIRAFMGNLEAAKRVRETVKSMPYSQRSVRTDECDAIAEQTEQIGGFNPEK